MSMLLPSSLFDLRRRVLWSGRRRPGGLSLSVSDTDTPGTVGDDDLADSTLVTSSLPILRPRKTSFSMLRTPWSPREMQGFFIKRQVPLDTHATRGRQVLSCTYSGRLGAQHTVSAQETKRRMRARANVLVTSNSFELHLGVSARYTYSSRVSWHWLN